MRNLCGLIIAVSLSGLSISAAELSVKSTTRPASTRLNDEIGDRAQDLKLTMEVGDTDGSLNQVDRDNTSPTNTDQASVGTGSSNLKLNEPKKLRPLKRKVLVFKASWCGACQSLNDEWPSLKKAGWRIGEKLTDHIQLVDADQRPDLISRYAINSLPTLVLVDGDKELSRQGSIGARNIAELYYGRLK
ncbi:MAG: thioredoxin family protein [Rhodopirellula sp.]|nr:thioredoxin family protein [Rhodopirellula sp.]